MIGGLRFRKRLGIFSHISLPLLFLESPLVGVIKKLAGILTAACRSQAKKNRRKFFLHLRQRRSPANRVGVKIWRQGGFSCAFTPLPRRACWRRLLPLPTRPPRSRFRTPSPFRTFPPSPGSSSTG